MANVRGKIFCQRCKTGNELGQDLCARCGTRLMLMVETSSARFEDRSSAGGMEEHLLERVTAIENNISRLIDKLEQMAELMLKGWRSTPGGARRGACACWNARPRCPAETSR